MKAPAFSLIVAIAALLAGPTARCEEELLRFVISNPSFGQVGAQTVRRDRRSDETLVSTEQKISVLFGLLFDYRSTQRELWRAGRLAEYQTSTLDDDDWHGVAARAGEDGITVSGHAHHGGDAPAEACPLNPVDRSFLRCTVLIEPKKGRIWRVRIEPAGEEAIEIHRKLRQAERYEVTGDFDQTLWYAPDGGSLLRATFEMNGYEITVTTDD